MLAVRLSGRLLLVLALLALGAEGFFALEQGRWAWPALGELWFALDGASLETLRQVVQHNLGPGAWDPGAIWLLRLPGSILAGVPALVLLLIGRRRRRPRRIFAPAAADET